MFTGIIEEKGKVSKVSKNNGIFILDIDAKLVCEELRPGDSVSVNGACLTVVEAGRRGFRAEIMQETINKTTFKDLRNGEEVNLERALTPASRLGGHFVTGHVDATGVIKSFRRHSSGDILEITVSKEELMYLVEKGSVAIDGISLTVIEVRDGSFTTGIIPHTVENTTLCKKKNGDKVNLEFDLIAKYIEKMLTGHKKRTDELYKNFLGG